MSSVKTCVLKKKKKSNETENVTWRVTYHHGIPDATLKTTVFPRNPCFKRRHCFPISVLARFDQRIINLCVSRTGQKKHISKNAMVRELPVRIGVPGPETLSHLVPRKLEGIFPLVELHHGATRKKTKKHNYKIIYCTTHR